MRPVLFRFAGIEIPSYPAFLFLGLVVGIPAGVRAGSANGLDADNLYLALLLLTIPAIVGSRLLYVLTHWQSYRARPADRWSRSGGGALNGGLILAFLLSMPVLPMFGLGLGAFWDAATITMLVGMIFTKIGCLLTGCCAGRPTSGWLGVNLPNTAGVWCRRVPSQLLECLLAALLLAGALSWRSRPFDGALFLAVLAVYSAARLPLGAARENVGRISGVNVLTVMSAGLLVASAAALALMLLLR